VFNIDASELILLLVLGVVMFGPEKLPLLARKAARVFVAVRNIANNAQTQQTMPPTSHSHHAFVPK